MWEDLPARLRAVLAFIVVCVEQNGFQPSYREIAAGLRISPANVSMRILKFEEAGVVSREKKEGRAISIKGVRFQAEYDEGT